MSKRIKTAGISLAIAVLLAGCQPQVVNTVPGNNVSINVVSSHSIKGTAVFPASPSLSIKATQEQVGQEATVALLYPSDHANPNATIATGLTTSSGDFSINPSAS